MKYLLDTCAISEPTTKRPAKRVVEWMAEQDETSLFLSVLTFGELQKGIRKLADGRKRRRLQHWVDTDLRGRFARRILAVDHEVASRWGELAADAEQEGRRVPVLDGLLGATALAHGLTLVTRNTKHLESTPVSLLSPWES